MEADYRGKGRFYTGRIVRDRGDGTFDIDYDDGEKESRVAEEKIRLLGGAFGTSPDGGPRLGEGSQGEAD